MIPPSLSLVSCRTREVSDAGARRTISDAASADPILP